MIEAQEIADVMGVGNRIHSLHDLKAAVLEGLPKATVRKVVSHVTSRRSEQTKLIHAIIPAATYKRRRTTLNPAESARTERMARVIATARYVWDDEDDARRFLTTPNTALGGAKPVDAAHSELGAREVEELLWRLFHGLPV